MTIRLADGTKLRDAIFAMMHSGAPNKEIGEKLNLELSKVNIYRRQWKKATGHPSMHHTEKQGLIQKWLEGKSGLVLYQSHAFKDDGQEGEMTKAFRPFCSEMVNRRKEDGDALTVMAAQFAEIADRDSWKFDVIACDDYGDCARQLERGLTSMMKKRGGLLFLTFNKPCKYSSYRAGLVENAVLDYGTPNPSEEDFIQFTLSSCYKNGHVGKHLETLSIGVGGEGVLVMVFQLSPKPKPKGQGWDRETLQKRLKLAKKFTIVGK